MATVNFSAFNNKNNHFLDEFKSFLEGEKNLSKYTIKAYLDDIGHFLSWIERQDLFKTVGSSEIKHYLSHISSDYSKNTLARKIASIKAYFKYLIREGIIDINPSGQLKSPRREKNLPSFLDKYETEALLNAPDITTPLGLRDKAIIELLYSTGIRVGELCALNLNNINLNENEITVFGKGAKERVVLLSNKACFIVNKYIEKSYPSLQSDFKDNLNLEKALFINYKGDRITSRSIERIIKNYSKSVIPAKTVTPHTLRHTFATNMLNGGADLRVVQELLGHSSISNTQIYTHVNTSRLKEVYAGAHPHS